MSLCHPVIWSMAAILHDSTVVVVVVAAAAAAVVHTRPRAIPLAMITMRKSTRRFPFVSHIWVAYGAPLGGSLGRRSSANKEIPNIKSISVQFEWQGFPICFVFYFIYFIDLKLLTIFY